MVVVIVITVIMGHKCEEDGLRGGSMGKGKICRHEDN
jgi:hypothetical protein